MKNPIPDVITRNHCKIYDKITHAAWKGRYLDGDTLCQVLLQYRNTPSVKDGLSLAQNYLGTQNRTLLLSMPVHLPPIIKLQLDQAVSKAHSIKLPAELLTI